MADVCKSQSPISSESEADKYLALQQCPKSTNPLTWWKSNEKEFPVLSIMAKDYLAVQASTVPCEQIFSSGVDLVTPNRNQLISNSIIECLSLKYWMKLK